MYCSKHACWEQVHTLAEDNWAYLCKDHYNEYKETLKSQQKPDYSKMQNFKRRVNDTKKK